MSEVLTRIAELKEENANLLAKITGLEADHKIVVAGLNREIDKITLDFNNQIEQLKVNHSRDLEDRDRLLKDTVASEVAKAVYGERVKGSTEKQILLDAQKKDVEEIYAKNKVELDEQQTHFNAEIKTLSGTYESNTKQILESNDKLVQEMKDANRRVDAWQTKFNEYIKSHL